jgi:hypothetical protein
MVHHPGPKTGFFDVIRHKLRVFSYNRNNADVTLSSPGTSTAAIKLGNGAGSYGGGEGIAEDSAGAIWVTWGHSLTRIDADNDRVNSWTLPSSSATLPSNTATVPSAGSAVSITYDSTHNTVMVLKDADPTVYTFSVAEQAWRPSGTILPIYPGHFTKLSVTTNGILLAQGTTNLINYSPALAFGTLGTATMASVPNVLQYALDSTGSQIARLDLTGAITRSSLAALGSVRLTASGEAPTDTPLVLDHNGSAWTWEHTELKPNIVERSSNGATTTYGFPVTPITFTGVGPRLVCACLRRRLTCWFAGRDGQSCALISVSVRVEPYEDARTVWCQYRDPGLVGFAELLLIELEWMGILGHAIARPVADACNCLAQAVDLFDPPAVVPGAGSAEIPFEQATELGEAVRAEHGDQKAFDLALAARGAAVLLLVEDSGPGAHHDVQPAGSARHRVWV